MTLSTVKKFIKIGATGIAFSLLSTVANAGDIKILEAWSPLAPPTAGAHAAYVSLTNGGTSPRILVSASSDQYGMVHIHESKVKDGVSSMMMVHQIEVPAGGKLSMAPGGLHIMLMHPKKPNEAGSIVPVSLKFANGESIEINVTVRDSDAAG